ncbi:hypothetical protein GGI11_000419 [Coemansia sp. RSA 2049]|nr:hypothetical protein GGI11_000419 [Coemansia sp. RSA 2049]
MTRIPTLKIGVPGNRVHVPRVGLGTAAMSSAYVSADDEESVKVLNRAIDIGCNLLDTADMYGHGHNEKLISRVLKERRKDVFLCTKFGIMMRERLPGETGSFADMDIGTNGSPEYMRRCIEGSLQRLGTDYIDLYYLHDMDPNVPIEETVAAMAELVKEGKVRYLGLSNCSAEDLRRAYKVHPIAAVQNKYSAWFTKVEQDGVLDACRELGVTFVAFTPLGRGLLTGEIRSANDLPKEDWRLNRPIYKPEIIEDNVRLVDATEAIAKKHGCTPSQLALAWLLAQYDNLVVLPGTKRIKHLEENCAAGQVKLSDEDVKEIRKFVDCANIEGIRF